MTVEVGASKMKYPIHRLLLEDQSEYFKRALNGPWKESQNGMVPLEDVECGTCMHQPLPNNSYPDFVSRGVCGMAVHRQAFGLIRGLGFRK